MKSALMVGRRLGRGTSPAVRGGVAPLLREDGFEVEIADSLDALLDGERLGALSLIVPVWTMGTITAEQEAGC
jgi:type 1 glutamine amidotransferase